MVDTKGQNFFNAICRSAFWDRPALAIPHKGIGLIDFASGSTFNRLESVHSVDGHCASASDRLMAA
jgi:hypothetical protein